MIIRAYKLMRVRKDGTLGPLFINPRQRIPVMKWLRAESHRTPGFAYRPGWHACSEPVAPHLSKRGRVWCQVLLRGAAKHHRPESQGGLWYTAKWMKVMSIVLLPVKPEKINDSHD
ncbi:MAG: hypothetical protein C5B59_06555 [Bacteroidetes bacterium]|nr:MAG: hypothetical protein C5B59_06555 [Bacteroidota bacterium]